MTTKVGLPRYPRRRIQRLTSLSIALNTPLPELQRLASVADSLYRPGKPVPKADGSVRETFDALPPLKVVQRRIKGSFLDRVQFPDYLTGSLKGCDSVSNAEIHAGAKIVVSEDVASFFPNTGASVIHGVWRRFFGFSPGVSDLLVALTTKEGCLPQGAVTSSHLANLVFWRSEGNLQRKLKARGITYSRYVDDITISSKRQLPSDELQWCIAQIYGMMFSCGLRPKRTKQEILRGNGPLRATKLLINRRAALPTAQRDAVRAAVQQLELRIQSGDRSADALRELNSVSGRVGYLRRLHPTQGERLKVRVKAIRQILKGSIA